MTSILSHVYTLNSHQKPTVGDTKISVVGLDHMGWLVCDGRLLSVGTYTFLFNTIGYQFGGSNGQFSLPNPAGRVPGIVGSGAGLTVRAMGASVGAETHTLTVAEMPTHTHGVSDPGHAHTYLGIQSQVGGTTGTNVAENDPRPTETTGSNTTGITLSNAGGSNAHNNMQPTLFIGNMFIYSGKPTIGNYPYTTGYYNASPNGLIRNNIL